MILSLTLAGRAYSFDASAPIDISIPLRFNGAGPGAFHIGPAVAQPVEAGSFVGDTRRGGGCNCETVTLNPHGNGTHTECVGHLTDERRAVADALREAFIPALLVSVVTENAGDGDARLEGVPFGDHVITRRALVRALEAAPAVPSQFRRALVIRTRPNDRGKLTAAYSGNNPAYLTVPAMRLVRELGVEHLLLDLPSVDREEDGGALAAHRVFWELPDTGHESPGAGDGRTITEMIFVSDEVPDGPYLLNLQIPSFVLDAAPSRPILFAIAPIA